MLEGDEVETPGVFSMPHWTNWTPFIRRAGQLGQGDPSLGVIAKNEVLECLYGMSAGVGRGARGPGAPGGMDVLGPRGVVRDRRADGRVEGGHGVAFVSAFEVRSLPPR